MSSPYAGCPTSRCTSAAEQDGQRIPDVSGTDVHVPRGWLFYPL